MLRTYHTTAQLISIQLIEDIKKRFAADEKLTITVSSNESSMAKDKILELLEIEKSFPVKRVAQGPDFNDLIHEINL